MRKDEGRMWTVGEGLNTASACVGAKLVDLGRGTCVKSTCIEHSCGTWRGGVLGGEETAGEALQLISTLGQREQGRAVA